MHCSVHFSLTFSVLLVPVDVIFELYADLSLCGLVLDVGMFEELLSGVAELVVFDEATLHKVVKLA